VKSESDTSLRLPTSPALFTYLIGLSTWPKRQPASWPTTYCYAHGNICKLCGWFGNRWSVIGGRDPGPFSPLLGGGVCQAFGIRKILPWQFPCTLAELSSWRGGMWAGRTRGTLATWTHSRRKRKCIAGIQHTVNGIQFTDYWLQFSGYCLF
jgi:hypothetical protein